MLVSTGCTDAAKKGAAEPTETKQAKEEVVEVVEEDADKPLERGQHTSGRHYWHAEKLGRVEAFEVVEGIAHARIVGHQGAAPYWLTEAELADEYERAMGYRDALESWVAMLRGTGSNERREGMKKLRGATKTERAGAREWVAWWDEFGDFVEWDEQRGAFSVNEARREARLPRARWGLVLRSAVDSDRYGRDDPIKVSIAIENTGDDAVWVNKRLLPGTDLELEVFWHSPKAVSYRQFRELPEAAAVAASDYVELEKGKRVERVIDVRKLLAEPQLQPGTYWLRATYASHKTGEELGLEGTAPAGELEGLKLFFRVVPW